MGILPDSDPQRTEARRLERRIALGLLDLEKEIISKDGVHINQLRMTKKDGAWLLMLKGVRNGTKLIAFISEPTWATTLVTGITSADCKYLNWKQDVPPWER